MSLNLHFPDLGWETVTQNWCAWWAGEMERALIVLECIELKDEATPHYASTFLGNYDSEIPRMSCWTCSYHTYKPLII